MTVHVNLRKLAKDQVCAVTYEVRCPRCLSAWVRWISYLGSREWGCEECHHRWEQV